MERVETPADGFGGRRGMRERHVEDADADLQGSGRRVRERP
jgi:hypothetical protein